LTSVYGLLTGREANCALAAAGGIVVTICNITTTVYYFVCSKITPNTSFILSKLQVLG